MRSPSKNYVAYTSKPAIQRSFGMRATQGGSFMLGYVSAREWPNKSLGYRAR